MVNNSEIAYNYFNAIDREHYNKGSHMFFEGGTLYSYGSHFILAQKVRNGYILNGDSYSNTTAKHQNYTRRNAPNNSPIIPFSALVQILKYSPALNPSELIKIEVIDVTSDTYEEYTYTDKEGNKQTGQKHHLGASLIKYRNKYFLSGIDAGSKRYNSYYLVQLKGKPQTVKEAFRDLASNLTDNEYNSYLEGKIKRQGEYFLIPTNRMTDNLLRYARLYNNRPNLQIKHNIDLSRGRGNPHIAKDYIKSKCDKYPYIRRSLRHPEHKMVNLKDIWHRVIKNTAIRSFTTTGNVD